MDIGDGDLVRGARTGDAAAFRVLVERYQVMARARASRLGADPDDVDDIVQEAFLQAFAALDRLRDPDRFAAWLAGIIRNGQRAEARRSPVTLLAEWPEYLHPVSAEGLPSAEELDDWIIRGTSRNEVPGARWDDYAVTTADGAATVAATVPHPYGNISLGQEFLADDYRGATVTLSVEVRNQDVADHAELCLDIARPPDEHVAPGPVPQRVHRDSEHHDQTITGSRDWTRYGLSAQVPDDAEHIGFDLTLTGSGQVLLRNVELTRTDP